MPADPSLENVDLAALTTVELYRIWLRQRKTVLAETGTTPSGRQLLELLEMELRLLAFEEHTRLIELHQERRKHPRRY